jgi:hypothetical protein
MQGDQAEAEAENVVDNESSDRIWSRAAAFWTKDKRRSEIAIIQMSAQSRSEAKADSPWQIHFLLSFPILIGPCVLSSPSLTVHVRLGEPSSSLPAYRVLLRRGYISFTRGTHLLRSASSNSSLFLIRSCSSSTIIPSGAILSSSSRECRDMS